VRVSGPEYPLQLSPSRRYSNPHVGTDAGDGRGSRGAHERIGE
jgi:hypothetical protein